MSGMRRIGHVTLTFLPYSEAWLYDLVTAPVPYEARVVAVSRENEDRFPFEPVLLIRAEQQARIPHLVPRPIQPPARVAAETCKPVEDVASQAPPNARPLSRPLRPSRVPRRRRRALSDDHELLRVRRERAEDPRALGQGVPAPLPKGCRIRRGGAGNAESDSLVSAPRRIGRMSSR